jgi:hypothetical protein
LNDKKGFDGMLNLIEFEEITESKPAALISFNQTPLINMGAFQIVAIK